MDAIEASSMAECIEFRIGAGAKQGRVECFAVPLRPGSSRRRTRWAFLVITELHEREAREALDEMDVELIERRGSLTIVAAWPRGPVPRGSRAQSA